MRASITCWKRIIPEKTNHQNETCFRSDWHMVQLDDHRNEYDHDADMSCSSTKQHDLWCDRVDGSSFHDDIYVNTYCLQFNQGLSPQYYSSLINFSYLRIMIEVPQHTIIDGNWEIEIMYCFEDREARALFDWLIQLLIGDIGTEWVRLKQKQTKRYDYLARRRPQHASYSYRHVQKAIHHTSQLLQRRRTCSDHHHYHRWYSHQCLCVVPNWHLLTQEWRVRQVHRTSKSSAQGVSKSTYISVKANRTIL